VLGGILSEFVKRVAQAALSNELKRYASHPVDYIHLHDDVVNDLTREICGKQTDLLAALLDLVEEDSSNLDGCSNQRLHSLKSSPMPNLMGNFIKYRYFTAINTSTLQF